MKKANKPLKEEKDASKKKSSLKPALGNQKETKYVKKNFFSPDDDDEEEDEDMEDLDMDLDDSFDEDDDFDDEDEDEDDEF